MTPAEAKRHLSRNIETLLQRKGWSRYRLSKESGISEQTISNIVNEAHEPRASIVATLAKALGVSTNRLIPSNREIPEKTFAESA